MDTYERAVWALGARVSGVGKQVGAERVNRVLVALALFSGPDGTTRVSSQKIASTLGIADSLVRLALTALEVQGLVTRVGEHQNGRPVARRVLLPNPAGAPNGSLIPNPAGEPNDHPAGNPAGNLLGDPNTAKHGALSHPSRQPQVVGEAAPAMDGAPTIRARRKCDHGQPVAADGTCCGENTCTNAREVV